MANPDLTRIMPALKRLSTEKVRELMFFIVGWCDGDDHFIEGITHWLSTEPTE
jgi:hypothetical protein